MGSSNLAILIAYWTLFNCRRRHTGGTALPGIRAKKIYPDILEYTSASVRTIIVAGTNGKSTTVRMILAIMRRLGMPCFANLEGANTEIGIITTFATHSNIFVRGSKKFAIIECDELYLEKICSILQPEVIVFTNIAPDQADRLGTVEHVQSIFQHVAEQSSATICVNMDCSLTAAIVSKENAARIIPYSADRENIFVGGQKHAVKLTIPGEYNLQNAAAACAVAEALHVLSDKAISALHEVQAPYGRMESFLIDNIEVTMNLTKNATGINLTLDFIEQMGNKYRLIFGVNNHEEDGRDTSWFQDMDIEKHRNLFKKVVLFGDCARELGARFQQGGIDSRQLEYDEDFSELLKTIKTSDRPVFMLLNYSCMMFVRAALARKGYVNDFWKQ